MSCCDPGDYAAVFTSESARRSAARYRKSGLDKTARRIVEWVAEQRISGASVLEIGGGIGDIQLELLRRGAARTTNLELLDVYDAEAAALAAEAGVSDRISRRTLDLAASAEAVEPHDIVILHRVVCCYADYTALLSAAASRATRLLVFSHPPPSRTARLAIWGENALRRLRRVSFTAYVHPPGAMEAVALDAGLHVAHRRHSVAWDVVALAR